MVWWLQHSHFRDPGTFWEVSRVLKRDFQEEVLSFPGVPEVPVVSVSEVKRTNSRRQIPHAPTTYDTGYQTYVVK